MWETWLNTLRARLATVVNSAGDAPTPRSVDTLERLYERRFSTRLQDDLDFMGLSAADLLKRDDFDFVKTFVEGDGAADALPLPPVRRLRKICKALPKEGASVRCFAERYRYKYYQKHGVVNLSLLRDRLSDVALVTGSCKAKSDDWVLPLEDCDEYVSYACDLCSLARVPCTHVSHTIIRHQAATDDGDTSCDEERQPSAPAVAGAHPSPGAQSSYYAATAPNADGPPHAATPAAAPRKLRLPSPPPLPPAVSFAPDVSTTVSVSPAAPVPMPNAFGRRQPPKQFVVVPPPPPPTASRMRHSPPARQPPPQAHCPPPPNARTLR